MLDYIWFCEIGNKYNKISMMQICMLRKTKLNAENTVSLIEYAQMVFYLSD